MTKRLMIVAVSGALWLCGCAALDAFFAPTGRTATEAATAGTEAVGTAVETATAEGADAADIAGAGIKAAMPFLPPPWNVVGAAVVGLMTLLRPKGKDS